MVHGTSQDRELFGPALGRSISATDGHRSSFFGCYKPIDRGCDTARSIHCESTALIYEDQVVAFKLASRGPETANAGFSLHPKPAELANLILCSNLRYSYQ